MNGRCLEHEGRADVVKVATKVGGDYRRAPRRMRCNICIPCARHLLTHVTQGHDTVSRWSVRGLRDAVARADKLALETKNDGDS